MSALGSWVIVASIVLADLLGDLEDVTRSAKHLVGAASPRGQERPAPATAAAGKAT